MRGQFLGFFRPFLVILLSRKLPCLRRSGDGDARLRGKPQGSHDVSETPVVMHGVFPYRPPSHEPAMTIPTVTPTAVARRTKSSVSPRPSRTRTRGGRRGR